LDASQMAGEAPETVERLAGFAELVRRWQAAVCLPIDQLLITLGQDWFTSAADLALTHKLAVLLRQVNNTHPHWRLPELASELGVIANNQRRFIGFSDADSGFDPDQYKGQVLVATLHKAKGLEWDRVYLTSVNDYDFPAGSLDEQFIAEKWFLRDNLNLEAETLAQLQAGLKLDEEHDWYQVGRASRAARLDYIRERLRLLYVGITRARKELVITWNTGKDNRRQPALPLAHLASYWEARQDDTGA
jgi:DNA helicase-2/ATP-dependent DNA helicase PcrA